MIVEDICEHKFPHPNKDWLEQFDGDRVWLSHHLKECDGCCQVSEDQLEDDR